MQAPASTTITELAAVVVGVVAVASIIFHAGFSWSTLAYLKANSATKSDIALIRADLSAELLATARKDFVLKESCDTRHRDIDRRLDVREAES